MPVLQLHPKCNASRRGLPNLYFCCHSTDLGRYFTDISNDILKILRCNIWYADPSTPRDQEFWDDLALMDLFVVPITADLLHTANTAIEQELPFALRHNKPILPLMQEQKLEKDFNRTSVFQSLQYLDKYNRDETALPYSDKLRNFFESHFISDELAAKIRSEFDAYMFLSYRKKDRRHAQKLMQLIHKIDFCRDIAIWYDEFLALGEDFNEGIAAAMDKSSLFLLAVTPSMLEYVPDEYGVPQKNYVARVEFPKADTAGMPIVPAQIVDTDRLALNTMFEKELDCTDAYDAEALREALRSKLDLNKLQQNDTDPNHNYLIGLAYLRGLDLEKDTNAAIGLMTDASNAGLTEATGKLVDIYRYGMGVPADSKKALHWQKKLVSQREKAHYSQPSMDTLKAWFWAIIRCADLQIGMGQPVAAFAELDAAAKVSHKATNLGDPAFPTYSQAIVDERKGDVCRNRSRYEDAKNWYASSLSLRQQLVALQNTPANQQCLCLAYDRMGDVCSIQREYTEAIKHYTEKLRLDRQFCANSDNSDDVASLFHALYKLAEAHLDSCLYTHADPRNALDKALEFGSEALTLANSLVSDNDAPLNLYRQSRIYTLMGKILFNDADLRRVTGAEQEVYTAIYEKADAMHQEGLQIIRSMYADGDLSLQTAQCLISAYRALGELYDVKSSEIVAIDYNVWPPQAEEIHRLETDRKLVETGRAYYNKALDLAKTAHRNFGIPQTAQTLFHCRMDMASTLAHLARLPQEPKVYRQLRKQTMEQYDEALKLAMQLSRKLPGPDQETQVARVYTYMAKLGDPEKRKYLPEAISIYKKLVKAYPKNENYASCLAGLEAWRDGKPGIFRFI